MLCAEMPAHHFLPFSVESESSTARVTCAVSSHSSSGIFQLHLFHVINITLPGWRGGAVPPAEVCLTPVPLVQQPAETQAADKLSLKNTFNPSCLPLVFPARSLGTCHLHVSCDCAKQLSSALRVTLLTYILLIYTHLFLVSLPLNPSCQAEEEKFEI